MRGYTEVTKQSVSAFSRATTSSLSSPSLGPTKTLDDSKKLDDDKKPQSADETESKQQEEVEAAEEVKQAKREIQDYENEDSGDEPRKIDHLVFVIHGIGQKMSERLGQSFVHGKGINST